jgi:hypothetical protein
MKIRVGKLQSHVRTLDADSRDVKSRPADRKAALFESEIKEGLHRHAGGLHGEVENADC